MHTVIVTGISRGLGAALAQALLARGHRVIGVGRNGNASLEHERYRYVECDLAHLSRVAAIVEPVFIELAQGAPAAVTLVNNAAVAWPVGRVGRLDDREVEAAIAVNAIAPVMLCNAFVRAFANEATRRRIINVSSGAAQTPIAGSAVYCMAKAALEMLSRTIAAETTSPNFACISLRPGILETDMQSFMRGHDPAHFPSVAIFRGFKENALLKAPEEVAARIVDKLVDGNVEHGRTYSHQDL
jgi:NAD(P)-dependent dehydrogenase (short-subunit alcohol dehydrogenase family)